MTKKESALSNTKIAIIFFAFLAFVVFVSLAFKVVLVVRAGLVDDSKRFTVSVSNDKNIEVISLSPGTKSIAVFKLDENINSAKAGQLLGVPIDAFIIDKSLNLDQTISSLFFKDTLNYKNLQTNLTIIDVLRLLLISRGVSESNVNVQTISYDLNTAEIDKIVGRLVLDELIEKDNQTIQIINGTDTGGLGNKLARLVTNIGGDVIIVATSDSPKKKSMISYIDKKTYTVERLQRILRYEAVKSSDFTISDITVIIGEDDSNPTHF